MKRSTGTLAGIVLVLLIGAGIWFAAANSGTDSTSAPTAAKSTPAAKTAATPDADGAPSWLFSTDADGGTLTPNGDGTFTLTLSGVNRRVTAFSDRPDRDAAVIPVGALFAVWPKLFQESAPNAVLAAEDANGTSTSVVVTLTDPALDGTTATFTAEVVESRTRRPELAALVGSTKTSPPTTFGAANLFIDDVKTVMTCSNQHLQTINPPGILPPGSTEAETEQFREECQAAGGQLMLMDLP